MPLTMGSNPIPRPDFTFLQIAIRRTEAVNHRFLVTLLLPRDERFAFRYSSSSAAPNYFHDETLAKNRCKSHCHGVAKYLSVYLDSRLSGWNWDTSEYLTKIYPWSNSIHFCPTLSDFPTSGRQTDYLISFCLLPRTFLFSLNSLIITNPVHLVPLSLFQPYISLTRRVE